MIDVTDGVKVDWRPEVPEYFETYLHKGGIIAIWDPAFQHHVDLQGAGRSARAIKRDVRLACQQLENARRFVLRGGKRRKPH